VVKKRRRSRDSDWIAVVGDFVDALLEALIWW
jgi:hypothetical protein